MSTQHSRLDEALGASEEQTELYLRYSKGVPQLATPRFAKSTSDATSSAGWQAGAAGEL